MFHWKLTMMVGIVVATAFIGGSVRAQQPPPSGPVFAQHEIRDHLTQQEPWITHGNRPSER